MMEPHIMMKPKNPPEVMIEMGRIMSLPVFTTDQMPMIAPMDPPTNAPMRNPLAAWEEKSPNLLEIYFSFFSLAVIFLGVSIML